MGNKLSLKLPKISDINFQAYYSSDEMGINKSSQRKRRQKPTRKTCLLAFLDQLLIVDNSFKVTEVFPHQGFIAQWLVRPGQDAEYFIDFEGFVSCF